MTTRSRLLLVWLTLSSATPLAAHAQEAAARAAGFSLVCEMRCSETRLRTGIATISWAGPAGRRDTNRGRIARGRK